MISFSLLDRAEIRRKGTKEGRDSAKTVAESGNRVGIAIQDGDIPVHLINVTAILVPPLQCVVYNPV